MAKKKNTATDKKIKSGSYSQDGLLTNFSNNLYYLLRQRKMSITEFSKKLDVSYARVDKWLKKKCFPNILTMINICDFFGYFDVYTLLTTDLSLPNNSKKAGIRMTGAPSDCNKVDS